MIIEIDCVVVCSSDPRNCDLEGLGALEIYMKSCYRSFQFDNKRRFAHIYASAHTVSLPLSLRPPLTFVDNDQPGSSESKFRMYSTRGIQSPGPGIVSCCKQK